MLTQGEFARIYDSFENELTGVKMYPLAYNRACILITSRCVYTASTRRYRLPIYAYLAVITLICIFHFVLAPGAGLRDSALAAPSRCARINGFFDPPPSRGRSSNLWEKSPGNVEK